MGITTANIGSLITRIFQKGDPGAAMAAGKGPVTAEWAEAHGYKQFRSPNIPLTKASVKLAGEGASLYGAYAKAAETKKRIKKVEKETEKKKIAAEKRRRDSKIMRRPSRERGIL